MTTWRERVGFIVAMLVCCVVPMLFISGAVAISGVVLGTGAVILVGLAAGVGCVVVMSRRHRHPDHRGHAGDEGVEQSTTTDTRAG